MKNIGLLILLLHIVTFGYSQRWQHIFGYSGTNEYCNNFIEFYDKGYLLSSSYDENKNWVIKTDINGSVLWEKIFEWENTYVGTGYPLQDSNGNIILAGSTYINDRDGSWWPMINKIDACGNPVFCKVFIDEDYEYAYFEDAILLKNQDILALGHHEKNSPQKNTLFLYYISSDGELLWKKAYATYQDHPLIRNPDGDKIFSFNGNYYIGGGCHYAYPDDPDHFWRRAFFCGIDSLFNEKWILPFAMDDSIPGDAYAILPLNDSVLMGAGIGFFLDDTVSTALYTNSFLMFINTDGEQLGYNRISNSIVGPTIQSNYITDIASINDSLYMATVIYGEDKLGGDNPSGEFIIDTSCNIYNKQSRPLTKGYSKIVKTFDNKYAISVGYKPADDWDFLFYKINSNLEQDTVYTGTYVYDSLCADSIESGVIDISDCLVIVDTEETPAPGEYFKNKNKIIVEAVPNPATGNIRLLLTNKDNFGELQLLCSDTFGRQLYSAKLDDNQSEANINISTWSSGMYVAYITSNGKMVGQCRFVVR